VTEHSLPYGRPRRVEGGVRARSARGSIGESWWSRRFIDVLESFALGSRLSRGRSYARAGQVLALAVEPGAVTASVQGSAIQPYRVRIGLATFDRRVWATVEARIADEAIHTARLLAGELPAELEEVFAAAGAPLFPAALEELALSCSCPDAQVPCKHLAATFYLLAEAFDADPFLLLRWRGRDRAALLSHLRALHPGPTASRGAAPEPAERGIGAAAALADLPDTAEDPSRFWFPPVPLPPRPPTLPAPPGVVLRQLPTGGRTLGPPRIRAALAEAYERFAADRPEPSR
jgi:uncharacterized Zn finger protein